MQAIIVTGGKQYVVNEGDTLFIEKLPVEEGKKVRVYKYKAKKGYHKRQGHRQPYTKVEIGKISV